MTNLSGWQDVFNREKKLNNLFKKLDDLRAVGKIIYPPKYDIFHSFRLTKLKEVKVVIVGQDPYCGPQQANGLAFSVRRGIKIPPTLNNIYLELNNDNVFFKFPNHGCLESWAFQGVLLLNTVLTVEAGKPHSHYDIGWEQFTDKIIGVINKFCYKIIFLLWGYHAQKKSNLIDSNRHFVLKAPHPSPLSAHRGFFGCNHFSQTNMLLIKNGKQPIYWTPYY